MTLRRAGANNVSVMRVFVNVTTPARCKRASPKGKGLTRPLAVARSRELNIRDHLGALCFGAEQHRREDRESSDGGTNHHRYREAHVPLGREI